MPQSRDIAFTIYTQLKRWHTQYTVIIPNILVYINMNWTSSRWMALEWEKTFNIPQYKWHINCCISSTLLSSNYFSSSFFRNKAIIMLWFFPILSTKLFDIFQNSSLFFALVCSNVHWPTSPFIFIWIVVIRTREILLWLIYLKALMNFRPGNRNVSDKYWFCCKNFRLVEC